MGCRVPACRPAAGCDARCCERAWWLRDLAARGAALQRLDSCIKAQPRGNGVIPERRRCPEHPLEEGLFVAARPPERRHGDAAEDWC